MSKPILYGPAFSTYVRSARLVMEEKGVDYDLVEFDFLQGPMPAEQIERQPFAKVPAFEHDGFQLYEVVAISRYVDEAFEGPSLQPENVRERARMTQIISVLDSYTYSCTVGQLVIQRLVMPMLGNQPDEEAISKSLPEIDTCMRALDAVEIHNRYITVRVHDSNYQLLAVIGMTGQGFNIIPFDLPTVRAVIGVKHDQDGSL